MSTIENNELLKKGMEIYRIDVGVETIEKFEIYMKLLLEWNQKFNLTAITDEREIITKHFLDSISCIQSGYDFSKSKVIDVGTGAGFPAVPIKIVAPDMKLTLLDSLNKRTLFLQELTSKLGLNCEIIHGRAEDFGVKKGYRESYDIVLSRAVAKMAVLVEYMLPFVKVGGALICQKGPAVYEEASEAKGAIDILGGSIKEIISTNVYNSNFNHYIAIVEKVKVCPGKYPRKAGMIEKSPIK